MIVDKYVVVTAVVVTVINVDTVVYSVTVKVTVTGFSLVTV